MMPNSPAIVELCNVSKSYGYHQVLHQINLPIYPGEFLTLLGPSGCGKTTLLRLISGFEQPDQGQIFIQNQDAQHMLPAKRKINTVFQSYALFPHMNVFDNVAFGLRCQNLPEPEIQQRSMDALQMVKLCEFSQRKPSQLSGGQQQRVAIARAAVNRPHVLLLDEPLSSLDYRLRKTMQIELKQLQRQLGIAFVLVTHDQEEALSLSDRVVVLNDGKIEQIGTPRELYEEPLNLTVANFVGETNIFNSVVENIVGDCFMAKIAGKLIRFKNTKQLKVNDLIHILLRPEDIRVYDQTEVDDTSHMLPGIVEEVIYKGTTVDLLVRLNDNTLISATEFFDEEDDTLIYTQNEKVWVNWSLGWEYILAHETI